VLGDVQEAASHADLRTTMRYDRARASLDRHATYIVTSRLHSSRLGARAAGAALEDLDRQAGLAA